MTLWPRICDVSSKNLVAEFGEVKVSRLGSVDIADYNLATLEARICRHWRLESGDIGG